MKKQTIGTVALFLGVSICSLTVSAKTPSAADGAGSGVYGSREVGSSSITFEGTKLEDGGLVLNTVPSFDFETHKMTESDYVINGKKSTEKLSVTDLRGGDTGFKVFAQASKLENGTNVLPWQLMKMTTTIPNSDPDVTGYANVDVKNIDALIFSGNKDSNGQHETADVTMDLQVNQAGVKTGKYTGTIQYTLVDGAQQY